MEIQKIESTTLRVFAKQEELGQGAMELIRKAQSSDFFPSNMEFVPTNEFEETGEYQIILYCC